MNENQTDIIAKLNEMNVGKSLEEEHGNTQKSTAGDYYSVGQIPEIGVPQHGNPHLLSAGEWGWFNSDTFMLEKEVHRLSQSSFRDLLRIASFIGVDEVFIQENDPIGVKYKGEFREITNSRYSLNEIEESLGKVANSTIAGQVRGGESVPFALSIPWINKDGKLSQLRFRGNATKTNGINGSTEGITLAIRRLGDRIPTLDELGVEQALRALMRATSGIIFVAGETGSGKSTYLASNLQDIAQTMRKIIAAYEFPIEYDLRAIPNRKSKVGQTDLSNALGGSFALAVKDAMRRNADIIFVGEIRDADSAAGAISLAQSGHLVFCTVHAGTPVEIMDRLLNFFPTVEQNRIRSALIGSVQALVVVRLLQTVDLKRVQLRGYLGFDNKTRRQLYDVEPAQFYSTVDRLYVTQGNTMLMELNKYRHRLSEDVYEAFARLYDDTLASDAPTHTQENTNRER